MRELWERVMRLLRGLGPILDNLLVHGGFYLLDKKERKAEGVKAAGEAFLQVFTREMFKGENRVDALRLLYTKVDEVPRNVVLRYFKNLTRQRRDEAEEAFGILLASCKNPTAVPAVKRIINEEKKITTEIPLRGYDPEELYADCIASAAQKGAPGITLLVDLILHATPGQQFIRTARRITRFLRRTVDFETVRRWWQWYIRAMLAASALWIIAALGIWVGAWVTSSSTFVVSFGGGWALLSVITLLLGLPLALVLFEALNIEDREETGGKVRRFARSKYIRFGFALIAIQLLISLYLAIVGIHMGAASLSVAALAMLLLSILAIGQLLTGSASVRWWVTTGAVALVGASLTTLPEFIRTRGPAVRQEIRIAVAQNDGENLFSSEDGTAFFCRPVLEKPEKSTVKWITWEELVYPCDPEHPGHEQKTGVLGRSLTYMEAIHYRQWREEKRRDQKKERVAPKATTLTSTEKKVVEGRGVILSPYNPNVILACNGERSAVIRTTAYPSYMGWREHSCEMEVYVNGKGPVHIKPTENDTDVREEMVEGTNVPLLRAGETIRTLQFQFLETEGQVEVYAEFKY